MKHSPIAAIAILTLLLLAPSCSRDKTPDVRDVRWGMSKSEVKKAETAELMKEGANILTYRIGGEPDKTEGTFTVTVDENGETRDALVTIETIRNEPSWDLVYVFEGGKLAMAAIHLRDTFDDPSDYIALMREKSLAISKELTPRPPASPSTATTRARTTRTPPPERYARGNIRSVTCGRP